jgi:SAM-dependent methyltransferase
MSTAQVELTNQLALPGTYAGAPSYTEAERLQKEHFDRLAELYEAHYSDACSREYRRRFIYEPMFEGLDVAGKSVLDAMCGSGQTSEYLLTRGAHATGLDISPEVIESYRRRWPESRAICRSALDTGLESDSFDFVSVVGGLHHMHPFMNESVREIHRVLKPGGYFCFMEPHSGSLPDIVRRVWYKHDSMFSDNEAAIDLAAAEREFSSHFRFNRVKYQGSVGFLLVLNSMIFRIPLRLKPLYTPLLLALESLISKLQGKKLSCFVVAQWQKK